MLLLDALISGAAMVYAGSKAKVKVKGGKTFDFVRIKPEQILVLWPSILKDAEKAGLYIRPGNKKGKLALAQAVGRLIRRVPKGTQGYKRIITQERRNYFAKTFNSLRIRMPGHLAGLVKALVSSIQSGPHTVTGIEHILEKKWKKCSRSNCQTKANKGRLCVKHGSRGICRAEGCTLKARVKHLCSSQRCIRRRQAAAGAAGNGVSSSSSSRSVAAASD
eukprot:gene16006-33939_t